MLGSACLFYVHREILPTSSQGSLRNLASHPCASCHDEDERYDRKPVPGKFAKKVAPEKGAAFWIVSLSGRQICPAAGVPLCPRIGTLQAVDSIAL
jgi:hypothetical protein